MGASSPHAAFDLVCPTVGGVLGDLANGDGPLDVDPRVGEILVTTEGIEEDRQHIWEGFPGPGGALHDLPLLLHRAAASAGAAAARALRALLRHARALQARRRDAAQAHLRLHPRLLAIAPDAGGARSRAARRRRRRPPLAADVLRLRLDDSLVSAGRRGAARAARRRSPRRARARLRLARAAGPRGHGRPDADDGAGPPPERRSRKRSITSSTPPSPRCPSSATTSTARSCATRLASPTSCASCARRRSGARPSTTKCSRSCRRPRSRAGAGSSAASRCANGRAAERRRPFSQLGELRDALPLRPADAAPGSPASAGPTARAPRR